MARILIIEDNAANLELMRYLLAAFGHAALASRDGLAGLALARSEAPDLVLCDVQMAGMDGFEVVRHAQAEPALAHLKIVAVTALAMVGDRDRILKAGFDGYLTKPIDPATFVRDVEAFLPREARGTAPVPQATDPGPAPPPLRGLTILAVDNREANLDFAASLFRASGYQVLTSTNSVDAFAMARRDPPDLILSDVCMEIGSGYDLLAAVRADPALSRLPFVFLTSTLDDEAERRRALERGATRLLFRPIEPEELLREIADCLAQSGKA